MITRLQQIGWVALCGLLLAPVATAGPYTLTLKSEVGVPQAYVSLVQVCDVAGAGEDMLARLRRVYLGQCPGTYSREYIRLRLRQVGILPAQYRFAGAELAVVNRSKAPRGRRVERPVERDRTVVWTAAETREAIERAVRKHLLARLGKQPNQVSLAIVNLVFEARRVARRGATRLEIAGGDGRLGPGVTRVPVAFWDAAGRRFYRHLRVRIRLTRRVLVALRDLARGARLSERDVAFREVALDSKTRGVLDDKSQLDSWRVGREIRAGEPLTYNKLKRFEMIQRGELVDVELLGDGFKLKIRGKAQRGGVIGARIPVMNLISRKTFLAEVVGVRQVRVDIRKRRK